MFLLVILLLFDIVCCIVSSVWEAEHCFNIVRNAALLQKDSFAAHQKDNCVVCQAYLWLLRHMACLTISFVRPMASQVYCLSDNTVCLAGCVSNIPGTQVVCIVWKVEV